MEVNFSRDEESRISLIASLAGTEPERLVKRAVLRVLDQDAAFSRRCH